MTKALRSNPSIVSFYGLVTATSNSNNPSLEPTDPFAPATALSPEHASKLHATLRTFESLFSEPSGLNDTVPVHHIDLKPGANPPKQRVNRMSPAQLEEVQRHLTIYLEKGWIRPSTSQYGAPVLFAAKADGSLRFCVDYRALNNITVKDRYPLPRVDELLDQLHGATLFTSLDLWQGYHQVRIAPEDIHKSAFNTRYGSYEFLVLPFGLTNAPSSFMRLMNNVLSEYLDKFVVVFLDDVLIYSKSEADHVQHVEMVLNKLRAANLHVKMSKCKFAQSSTTFLGYVVSAEGLKVDPRKIAAVADWPTPTDLHSVRSFLGFCGFYRRFVKDYAKIAHALTELTKTTVPFPKTLPQAALDAFHLLKAALTTTPVLAIPFTGPDATFELYTDASGKGLGAVLLQDQGKGPQPVCYESRKLIPAECNYPVHEQELLAVVYACKKFRHYLDGCKHFKLYTDHHSLRFFFSQRDLSKRQARWSQVLAEFQPNMEIMYRPGPDNQADALSRLFPLDLPTPDPKTHTLLTDLLSIFPSASIVLDDDLPDLISSGYDDDPLYSPDNNKRPKYLRYDESTGLWSFKDRICIPKLPSLLQRILHEYHDTPSAGHPGYLKTLNAVAQRYWWPHMTRTIRHYCATCSTCQRIKPATQKTPGLLHPHSTPSRPWSHVSIDFITKLPPSLCYDGQTYDSIATLVCMLTKRALFIRCKETITANYLAHLFMDHVYAKTGLPILLVSDRDPRFTSEFWRSLFSALKTRLNLSTSHHPATDGQTEITHRSIEQILRAYVHPLHDDWSTWLPLAEFAYNNRVHSSTGHSPFYASYGFHPHTPASFIFLEHDSPTPDAQHYLDRMRDIQENIRIELDMVKAQQASQADKHRRPLVFKPGDLVRLSSDYITLYSQPSKKFRDRFLGPFKVKTVIPPDSPTPSAYELELPSSMSRVHPVFHVSRLLPWTTDQPEDFPGRVQTTRALSSARDFVHGDAYLLDSIYDVKIMPDPESRARPKALDLFFRVKWAPPYSDPSEDSWEPRNGVKRTDHFRAFLKNPVYQAFTKTPEFQAFAKKFKAKVPTVVTFEV